MAKVELEDIVGVWLPTGELVCVDCMEDHEWDEISQENILTEDSRDDDSIYFCDRHRKKI